MIQQGGRDNNFHYHSHVLVIHHTYARTGDIHVESCSRLLWPDGPSIMFGLLLTPTIVLLVVRMSLPVVDSILVSDRNTFIGIHAFAILIGLMQVEVPKIRIMNS